jgi:colanic acid biosynthesis protein WcaH
MTMDPSPLHPDTLVEVVRHAPLISIDLLVFNNQREVLLGFRANRPAQHTWFVPGGRIRKGERLSHAFGRTVQEELGLHRAMGSARPAGVYEHFYDDNFAAIGGFGTHYVVLAYALDAPDLQLTTLPSAQHVQYRWCMVTELLRTPDVHPHVKAYFDGSTPGVPGEKM